MLGVHAKYSDFFVTDHVHKVKHRANPYLSASSEHV